jgi:hypothetical protein
MGFSDDLLSLLVDFPRISLSKASFSQFFPRDCDIRKRNSGHSKTPF